MKEKGFYIGIGIFIGVAIGLISSSKFTMTNVGHLEKLIIIKSEK